MRKYRFLAERFDCQWSAKELSGPRIGVSLVVAGMHGLMDVLGAMTPEFYRALYETHLDRMTAAGWIDRFTYTPEKGVTIRWTKEGGHRAATLKELIKIYDLCGGPHAPRMYDIHASKLNRKKLTLDADPERKMAYFWRSCIKELGLHRDDFDFGGLVHVVAEFAPDLKDVQE